MRWRTPQACRPGRDMRTGRRPRFLSPSLFHLAGHGLSFFLGEDAAAVSRLRALGTKGCGEELGGALATRVLTR